MTMTCMTCTTTDERFASIAAEESSKSTMSQRHGCLAVINGKIFARGYNSYYKQSLNERDCCSCHAEQDVLRQCMRNIKKPDRVRINIYIVRCRSDGVYMQSEPCFVCYNEMKRFNIKNIIYSTNDGTLIKCAFSKFKTTFQTSGMKALIEKRIIPLNIINQPGRL
jgi:deoxycytidylate deaminase